jgi:hypothetical protein
MSYCKTFEKPYGKCTATRVAESLYAVRDAQGRGLGFAEANTRGKGPGLLTTVQDLAAKARRERVAKDLVEQGFTRVTVIDGRGRRATAQA